MTRSSNGGTTTAQARSSAAAHASSNARAIGPLSGMAALGDDLLHWWEAWDDPALITSDGGGVSGVANQGRNGTPMTPYAPSDRLTYNASGGANGKPYFSSSGSKTLLAQPSGMAEGTPVAIFIVATVPADSWPVFIGNDDWGASANLLASGATRRLYVYPKDDWGESPIEGAAGAAWHGFAVVMRADETFAIVDGVTGAVAGTGGSMPIDYAWFYCGYGARIAHLSVITNPTDANIDAVRLYLFSRYAVQV